MYCLKRDQANQTVKTLLAYGYNLEPPTSETGESAQTGKLCILHDLKIKHGKSVVIVLAF